MVLAETKQLTLDLIEQRVDALAASIEAPATYLPTYGSSEDLAHPHIESDPRGYHYVVVERGIELSRKTTPDIDVLLSWVFLGVTFEMACKYELAHRISNQDFRRLLWKHQLLLLSRLSPKWAEVRKQEIEAILKQNPFMDSL